MLGTAITTIHNGFQAELVRVEADVSSGFPRFSLVGLPDSAVRESKLRIRSAIRNSHLTFPQGRITVNLTPANFRKRGSGLDLAIAIAILRASGQLPEDDGQHAFLAELQLSGALAPAETAVGLALRLASEGMKGLFLSTQQQVPDELSDYLPLYQVDTLSDVVGAILQSRFPHHPQRSASLRSHRRTEQVSVFADIHGRSSEKRILTIAAAGRHHVLLIGPPGIGKTKLSSHLIDLLPDLAQHRALQAYARNETSGTHPELTWRPPVRAPHHSLTPAGMIGGGTPPQPGEVTLAHDGILMLDELFEFQRITLNALREPLVNHTIQLTRGGRSATLPAHFLLIATANPCPCGQRGYGECRCHDSDVRRYWGRCSGPVIDRIDIIHYMNRQRAHLRPEETRCNTTEDGQLLRTQVTQAREILSPTDAGSTPAPPDHQYLDNRATQLLSKLSGALMRSERATKQLLQLSRTVAALDGRDTVSTTDVEEAVQLCSAPRGPQ